MSNQLYVVTAPVADLRAKPGSQPSPSTHDPLEETQLLYGERVRIVMTQDRWAKIEALEQPEYSHQHRWQGYPGWIALEALQPVPSRWRANAVVTAKWAQIRLDHDEAGASLVLPMGASLAAVSNAGPMWQLQLPDGRTGWIARQDAALMADLRRLPAIARRRAALRAAESLIGDPYFWGGRSPHEAGSSRFSVTGVDCSGLVNLAYRTVGIEVPRDAHEQYLRAKKVSRPQPGDLIFLSDAQQPGKIVHVMLYAGDGWLIEGPGTGMAVRRISVEQRFGRALEQLKPGERVRQQTVVFGAYLP